MICMYESWQSEILFSDTEGYEIVHHQGDGSKSVDWREEQNRKDCIEICLNLEGRAEIVVEGVRIVLNDRRVGLYDCSARQLKTRRNRGYGHRFSTLSLKKEYLQDQLAPSQFFLKPSIRQTIFDKSSDLPLCTGRDMEAHDQEWLSQVSDFTHIPASGKLLWMQSKVMEFIAGNFFNADLTEQEMFCDKIKRSNSDRVVRTKLYLEENFSRVFNLDTLAINIGCSASYLSRLFSRETGQTIKCYLRSVRMRKARALLSSGKANVTEAAYECGYSSLSHFAKAFQCEFGCTPSMVKA